MLGRGTCRSLSVTMEVVDDERKVDRGDARNQRRLSHRSGGWAWPWPELADVNGILDPNAGHRSSSQWQHELGDLVSALSASTGIEYRPTSWVVEDDRPGFACACNCVNVRGSVNTALELDVCGVVFITVNFGEEAWASSDLLLFAAGRRVRGPGGTDLVHFSYTSEGWVSKGWMTDDNGEWESHTTDEWWEAASPDLASSRGEGA